MIAVHEREMCRRARLAEDRDNRIVCVKKVTPIELSAMLMASIEWTQDIEIVNYWH